MAKYIIRPLDRTDREWVAHFLDEYWGTTQIVSRGKSFYGHLLPGIIAERVIRDVEAAEVVEASEIAVSDREESDTDKVTVDKPVAGMAKEKAKPEKVEFQWVNTIEAIGPDDKHRESVALLTYNIEGTECEITTLDSKVKGDGVGSAVVDALLSAMKESKIMRIWLITTNDNLDALRFWQKRGFVLTRVHRDAITDARRIKPQIPITGHYGIPIRDEIELEYDAS